MTNEELREVTNEVRKLLLQDKSFKEIRSILKQKYPEELISGAFVQVQIKVANKRLAHRKKTIRIVRRGSNFNLIILLGLIGYALAQKGNAAESIITSIIILSKLFSMGMIIDSISRVELRWTITLAVTFFIPGLDIIGAGWYFLIVKLNQASSIER